MALQVSDRAYAESGWVSQYAAHPWAPLSFLLAESLRQAYVHAQAHGRVLLQQPYWYDAQDLSGDLSRTRAFTLGSASVWGGVARGWVPVPKETSHLDALVIFAVQTMRETQVDLRLTIVDGSANTDNATSATLVALDPREEAARAPVAFGLVGGSQNDRARLYDAEAPFLGPFRVHLARVRVALSNVPTDDAGRCEVRVEARANAWNDGTEVYDIPVGLMPLWVEVLSSMDDFQTTLVDTAEGGTTLSPLALSLGQDVTAETLDRVRKQQDWSMARRPQTHLNLCVADDGWDDYSGGASAAVGPFGLIASGSAETIISTDLWISKEFAQHASLECGAECLTAVGETVRLAFTFTGSVGAATGNVDCADTDNGTEVTATVTTSLVTLGDEWVTLTITMQRTVGSGSTNEVRQLRVSETEIASLPGPVND